MAILADRRNYDVKTMAEGLERMLSRAGVQSTVVFDGLNDLGRLPIHWSEYITSAPTIFRFLRMRQFDAIVVVKLPGGLASSLFHVETLRRLLPRTPLVLYSKSNDATESGIWRIEEKAQELPMGRFDWYLAASVPRDSSSLRSSHPVSVIGLDLNDGTPPPGSKPQFEALLDFERPEYVAQRAVQIQALEDAGIRYAVLQRTYSIERMKSIYRTTCVYFLANPHVFGLPICEVQACGGYVCTPDADWCRCHSLTSNVIVYGNDKRLLVEELQRIRGDYDPQRVIRTFRTSEPSLFYGNDEKIQEFIGQVRSGAITSESHRRYSGVPT
jgi:hypothetical protein